MVLKDSQPYLDVAISILRKQDVSAIPALKDFLQGLPTPKQVEKILALAILHFAEDDLVVFAWILQNKTAFAPELDFLSFTKRLVRDRLTDLGWQNPQDFEWDVLGQRLINKLPIYMLKSGFRQAEWRLITAIWTIESSA